MSALPASQVERSPRRRSFVLIASVAFVAAYVLLQFVTIALRYPPNETTAIWLPLGLTTGVMLVTLPKTWWMWLCLSFLCVVPAYLNDRMPPWAAISLGLAACSIPLLTVVGTRWFAPRAHINEPKQLITLVLVGFFVILLHTPPISWAVTTSGWRSDFWITFRRTAVCLLLGLMIVAPAAIAAVQRWRVRAQFPLTPTFSRVLEGLAVTAGLTLSCVIAFGKIRDGSPYTLPMAYLPLPFLLWAGLRFGVGGASAALFAFAVLATWYAGRGFGPLSFLPIEPRVFTAQMCVSAVSLPMLILSATVAGRMRDQLSLKQSERRFRATFEQAAVGMYQMALNGTFIRVNTRLAEMLGYTTDELMQLDPDQIVHPDDRAEARTLFRRLINNTASTFSVEHRYRKKDGSWLWIDLTASMAHDAKRAPEYILSVVRDLSQRKAIESELTRAKEAAEAANRAKDQFLGVLSHELRTPLTPTLLILSSLEHDRDVPKAMREDISMVREQVELEARLIDDLLDTTRIARSKLRLERSSVNAHEVLLAVVAMFEHEIREKELVVETTLKAHAHHLQADAMRVRQAFWNLISNAIKYTPAGGHITIRSSNVESATFEKQTLLRISVADDGIGIEPELMSRLFQPFEQGEQSLTRQGRGLGLGLSITKALVEMHGGQLRAESAGKNQGSTFTIDLPTINAPTQIPENEETSGNPIGNDRAFPGGRLALLQTHASSHGSEQPDNVLPALKILLVEDDPGTVRALSHVLGDMGHHVTVAGTVASALEAASTRQIDLLISDIGLPDGDGWELLHRLQIHTRPMIPAIALSGFASPSDAARSEQAGFLFHLTKPIHLEQLQDTIAAAFATTPSSNRS